MEVTVMLKIPFWKQKTTWTAIMTAFASGGAMVTGDIEPYTGVMGIFGSLTALFLRQGIEKTKGQ